MNIKQKLAFFLILLSLGSMASARYYYSYPYYSSYYYDYPYYSYSPYYYSYGYPYYGYPYYYSDGAGAALATLGLFGLGAGLAAAAS